MNKQRGVPETEAGSRKVRGSRRAAAGRARPGCAAAHRAVGYRRARSRARPSAGAEAARVPLPARPLPRAARQMLPPAMMLCVICTIPQGQSREILGLDRSCSVLHQPSSTETQLGLTRGSSYKLTGPPKLLVTATI